MWIEMKVISKRFFTPILKTALADFSGGLFKIDNRKCYRNLSIHTGICKICAEKCRTQRAPGKRIKRRQSERVSMLCTALNEKQKN